MDGEPRKSPETPAALDAFVERLLRLVQHGASAEAALCYAWLAREARYGACDDLSMAIGIAATELRKSESGVRNSLEALKRLGLVHKHRGGGRGIHLSLALDDPLEVLEERLLRRRARPIDEQFLFAVDEEETPAEQVGENPAATLKLVQPVQPVSSAAEDARPSDAAKEGNDDDHGAGGVPSAIVEQVGPRVGVVDSHMLAICRLDWSEPVLTIYAPNRLAAEHVQRRKVTRELLAALSKRCPQVRLNIVIQADDEKPQGADTTPAVLSDGAKLAKAGDVQKPQGTRPPPAGFGGPAVFKSLPAQPDSEKPQGEARHPAVFAQQPTVGVRNPYQGFLTPTNEHNVARPPSQKAFDDALRRFYAQLGDPTLFPWIAIPLLLARESGHLTDERLAWLRAQIATEGALLGAPQKFEAVGLLWRRQRTVKQMLREAKPGVKWERRWEKPDFGRAGGAAR